MATTTQRKLKQVEIQQLVQENNSDSDPDYEDISSISEQESDKTVSDTSGIIINVPDDDDVTNIERFSPKKQEEILQVKLPSLEQVWIWKCFKDTEDNTKLIRQIEVVEKHLHCVVLSVQ